MLVWLEEPEVLTTFRQLWLTSLFYWESILLFVTGPPSVNGQTERPYQVSHSIWLAIYNIMCDWAPGVGWSNRMVFPIWNKLLNP
jgi:hypothetical protein